MIPLDNLVAFAVASVVIIAIPGPSVLFVIGRSLSLGRRAGVLSVVGNALGTVPAVLAVPSESVRSSPRRWSRSR